MKAFEKFMVNRMEVDNHVGIAPMCTYLCDTKDGVANMFHFSHYNNLALGQPGFIIQEATAVNEKGYISENCLGIYNPRQKEALTNLVEGVHQYKTKIGIQLNHAGRKSKLNIIKDGAIDEEHVQGLSEAGILKIVDDFAAAAKSARHCGYDFIEIHGAHGYLVNQFLSPITNKRSDAYGQDRFLFLEQILKAVKHEFEGPIFVRISADEYHPEGNTIKESIELAKKLESLGVALINVSSGGFVDIPFEPYPLYQVPFAEAIRAQVSIPVATAGLISTMEAIETILDKQQADVILLGRKALLDPYFMLKEKYKHGLIQQDDIESYLYRALKTL